MEQNEPCRPIPAPRRLYSELPKTEYENVSVELINKNVNIRLENIHQNSNCNDKVPNNKAFLANIQVAEDAHLNNNNNNNKCVLTETNDLYGPNANENVPNEITQPMPTPRGRKPQNTELQQQMNYENVELQMPAKTSDDRNQLKNSSNVTALRKAPDLPPKTYMSAERERKRQRALRHSVSSEVSTTSSYNVHNASYELHDRNFDADNLPKSASSYTLNSSIADSNESSESSLKYKSPSPGYVEFTPDNVIDYDDDDEIDYAANAYKSDIDDIDNVCASSTTYNPLYVENAKEQIYITIDNKPNANMGASDYELESETVSQSAAVNNNASNETDNILKSLGATSKLLAESIGERVALKSKGAKHKLDKNLKTSGEVLSQFSTDTTQRLMNASKRLGANFSSNKKDKEKPKESSMIIYADRPQTLPPNDKVFNSIAFSSPLSQKTQAVRDLSSVQEQDQDNSYEVPKHASPVKANVDALELPTYEDAIKSSPELSMRNSNANAAQLAREAAKKVRARQMVPHSIDSRGSTSTDLSRISLPMPNFPPPELPADLTQSSSTQAVYGKLNAIQAPARHKRQRNYEQIEFRCDSALDAASLRVHMDTASEREDSLRINAVIEAQEARTPKAERSDSWQYFEDKVSGAHSQCSTPEPLYANNEATYGKLFEMESSNRDLLQAEQNAVETLSNEAGAVGGEWLQLPAKELIQEFDPLLARKSASICRSNKSNELLLLEHLLEEETYGVVQRRRPPSDDDISMCTSEEDNGNVAAAAAANKEANSQTAATKQLLRSSKPEKKLQIVHQNAQLLSESMENMLDDAEAAEERIRPYLSRVDEPKTASGAVDLSHPSNNRSNWYLRENKENASTTAATEATRFNPFDKMLDDGESPPSYLEAIGADGKPAHANEPRSRASRFMNSINVFSNFKNRVDALKRQSSFKVANEVKVTLQMIPRPSLSPLLVRHEGPLIRFPSGVVEDILKEMQNRKAILRDRQFQTFLEQEMKTPKEMIPLESITTLQCVSNSRVTDNSTHIYCFEITTSTPKNSTVANIQALSSPNLVMTSSTSGNCKQQRVTHLYGVGKESERGVWMQKILESLTNFIPPKFICHYYRAGWCYLKNSITSEWTGTWLVLKKSLRRLIFVSEANMNVEKMDLRKARCIAYKESDDSIKNLHVEYGPMFMIDCPPYTVYMIMSSPRETKIWRNIIREVAHNNGFALNDQQLTKFNVPVIVDKCINFIYIHGSMSEGIYRKSGAENAILKLLADFRADAFNVEITRNQYNEHDVANVLKRFMRDLPERLLGKYSSSFISITALEKSSEKIDAYKELLSRLSVIERETLKRLVCHLAFISSQKLKNKMGVQNLTMIWGPTLLQDHQQDEMIYSQKESDVLADLIMLHKHLFPVSMDEMKKEQDMLLCLQKYYAAAESLTDSFKKSGDLKMWITVNPNPENTTEEKTQVNVTISPTKTAYEVCQELAPKMNMSIHQISLHEVICNGNLERPLHHDSKVFEVVLSWSYWPEEDRKHNCLVVKPVDLLREVQRAVKNLATVTPGKELKFADNRTKSFKSYQCELRDGKIVVSKKEKNDKTTIVREIFLQSCTAYLGCEKKRDFPWSWAITFVERTQKQIMRSRDSPFIGHVMAGSEWVDRTIWYSSIWYCLYGESILPPAEIILK